MEKEEEVEKEEDEEAEKEEEEEAEKEEDKAAEAGRNQYFLFFFIFLLGSWLVNPLIYNFLNPINGGKSNATTRNWAQDKNGDVDSEASGGIGRYHVANYG